MVRVVLEFQGDTMAEVRGQMDRWAAEFQGSETGPPATRSFATMPVTNPVPQQLGLLAGLDEEGSVPSEESINAEQAVIDAAIRYGKKYGTAALRKLLKKHGAERAKELPEEAWVPFINDTI